MNLIVLFIISMIINALLLHKYSRLKWDNLKYRKALDIDRRVKIPSMTELMEVYEERKFHLYTWYALFPFLDKWRKNIIEKGKEGMVILKLKLDYTKE